MYKRLRGRRTDEAHDQNADDEPQDIPYPPGEGDANWTQRRLERMTEERFLAEVQRALCDAVGDAAERVRSAEDYLPLLEGLLYAWDEFGLPSGARVVCGLAVTRRTVHGRQRTSRAKDRLRVLGRR